MKPFQFDPRLLQACIRLGRLDLSHLLLMNNSAVPWFILVPETEIIELCDLDGATHLRLFGEVNLISRMVRSNFAIDKLNIATLGNKVPQMHLHVIGRSRGDYCWPGGVWGASPATPYAASAISDVAAMVASTLGPRFHAHADG